MRTFVLVAGVFALLVGLFIGYATWQTGEVRVEENRPAPAAPARLERGESGSIVGATERPWVTQYDAQWRPTSQFRAASFEPISGDRVQVVDAEARFFLGGGELIRVRGASGTVVMTRLPESGQDPRQIGPAEPPTRGELKDVEIELFESAADLEADTPERGTSILRVVLNNAAFDNETFRIYTDDAVINGRPVPASEIPVVVTGRDYDFEGQGLTIRWNERDRRLELLRVHKGRRLVVKNPEALDRGMLRPRQALAAPLPVMLAETDDQATREALATASPRREGVYRATFRNNLRIVRGQQELVRGDEMFIDFHLLSASADEKPATTQRTATGTGGPDAATTAPAAIEPVKPAPAPAAVARQAPAARRDAAPQPLTVWWDGELLVQPLADESPAPAASNAILHMVGTPLRITQPDSTVTCASLLYDGERQTLALDGSEAFPLQMRSNNGAQVKGQRVTYLLPERLAIFRGQATASLPVRENAAAEPQALTVQWTEQCRVSLAGSAEELAGLQIEQAEMLGDVLVEHPSLRLSAQRLHLQMQPAGEAEADMRLRELTATGKVECVLRDEPDNPRTITGRQLHVQTGVDEQERLYPKEVRADGTVVASDARQSFRAEHLVTRLAPAKREGAGDKGVGVELEHLVAIGNAEYAAEDGRAAAADQIEVTRRDGEWEITLLGDVLVGDGQNVLHGPHVQAFTAEQLVRVRGAGTLDAVREADGDEPRRAITAEWTRGVVVDGVENRVDVAGGVVVTTSEADGTSHAIVGDTMRMNLVPAPKEAAAENGEAAEARAEGAQPRQADAPQAEAKGDADADARKAAGFLSGKVVNDILFEGNVAVRSLKTTAQGEMVRRLNLESTALAYDVPGRRMVVPAPGRLLFQDHPQVPEGGVAEGRERVALNGNTAMAWRKGLVYDQLAQVIELEGEVLIVHESDQQRQGSAFELRADLVTAELTGGEVNGEAQQQEQEDQPQLRRLIAQRRVSFKARGIDLTCSRIEFDPATGWLVASGSEAQPVHVREGTWAGEFGEARYNLHSEQVQVKDFRGNIRR